MLTGLLIDSGDTLMHPRGGRWNPRFDFEDVVTQHVGTLDHALLPAAFAAGEAYLQQWTAEVDRIGPTAARADYHRTILAALGIPAPSDALLEELDRPLPFTQIVEPFDDTADGLARLRDEGWRIAVVADTSPRMVEVYRALDLDGLIETFVISEELGCSKPDPRMFQTASDRLGLPSNECVFVDDNPVNLAGAFAAGYLVCGMDRYGGVHEDRWPWVRDLSDLASYLAMLRRR